MILNDKQVGDIVKIEENGEVVEFLIVHKGNPNINIYDTSCDGVWLLRKDILTTSNFNGSNNRDMNFSSCTLKSYLNDIYFKNGINDKIKQYVLTVKIPYNGYGFVNQGQQGTECSVFALSVKELGITTSYTDANYQDGTPLDYFKNATSSQESIRIANFNATATDYWTRTANYLNQTGVKNCVTEIGSFTVYDMTTKKGVRPAFIMDYNTPISKDGNILDEPDTSDTPINPSFTTINSKNVGDIIKINEGNVATDYIIVNKGNPNTDIYDESCNGIWVVRKNQINKSLSFQTWDYTESEVSKYLNGEFYSSLDNAAKQSIYNVKIPYNTLNENLIATGTTGFNCQVFLLSAFEIGFTKDDNSGLLLDGEKLTYFSNNTDRVSISDIDGTIAPYLLRSVTMFNENDGSIWGVKETGELGSYTNAAVRGIRLAMILDPQAYLNADNVISEISDPSIKTNKYVGEEALKELIKDTIQSWYGTYAEYEIVDNIKLTNNVAYHIVSDDRFRLLKVIINNTEYSFVQEKELTQAEYDALTDEEKHNGTTYYITDGTSGGGGSGTIDVDSELSETSTNPVQNKVITAALKNKIDFEDELVLNCIL